MRLLVPVEGLEPPRNRLRQDLNLLRLPVPPDGPKEGLPWPMKTEKTHTR